MWAEHELVAQVEGLAILRELHPHGAHDGETSLSGLVEQVVHVVRLCVPLLNSSEDDPLDTRRLQPRLTHLVADLGVGAEEWEVNTELIELYEQIIDGDTRVAWHVSTRVGDTGDTEREHHVDGELSILELGVVGAGTDGTVSL